MDTIFHEPPSSYAPEDGSFCGANKVLHVTELVSFQNSGPLPGEHVQIDLQPNAHENPSLEYSIMSGLNPLPSPSGGNKAEHSERSPALNEDEVSYKGIVSTRNVDKCTTEETQL